jgi:xanthine dehydrogenase accessory factor
VVDETGAFIGSVSAGCVENDVIVAALDVIADGVAQRLEFGVADETAWRVGLSCGRRICVLVQKLDEAAAELLAVSLRMSAERRACDRHAARRRRRVRHRDRRSARSFCRLERCLHA